MPDVMNKLQTALPKARLMWHSDGPAKASITITFKEEEHYVGVSLDEPGLDEAGLVRSIVSAVS